MLLRVSRTLRGTTAMLVPFSGRCACGKIRYECHAPPVHMFNCHCRDCQYASGSAYTAAMLLPLEHFRLLQGEPKYFRRAHDDGTFTDRGFCPECGTPIFAKLSRRPEWIGIRAGTLDDPSWFRPTVDFWTSSAQPWDFMNPEVQKHPRQPVPGR